MAELGAWLRARGVEETEATAAIEELIAIGTLDDARFAAAFAADKRELAGWGEDRIREALIGRGVGREEIDAALAEDADGELERAIALLRERRHDLGGDPGRRRALGLLARRGYEAEVAYEAIRRAAAD